MATAIIVDFDSSEKSDKFTRYAETSLIRWAERQGGAAFVSADCKFILTDYRPEHKEVGLLRHILNCQNLAYRCIGNIDLCDLGEILWDSALNRRANNKFNITQQN